MLSIRRSLSVALTVLLAVASAVAQETNPNIRFGMPAPAKTDPESREAFLIVRPQYVLSYNAKTRTPNWVSWRLRKEDIGNTPRVAFEPDPALPLGIIARVTTHEYDGWGFDRGHMCPAKDRSASWEDSQAVFYMTNIVPQSPASNQHAWERLEDYCRRLANQGHVLHIVCGPQGVGGTGKLGFYDEVGKSHKITVPARLWKVVLVLPRDDADPHKNTRVITVVMPNDQTVNFDWAKYRTSPEKVEKLTGFTFFPNVPDGVAQALRSQVDDVHVKAPTSKRSGGR
jgi:endonuclease G, mitochondrial